MRGTQHHTGSILWRTSPHSEKVPALTSQALPVPTRAFLCLFSNSPHKWETCSVGIRASPCKPHTWKRKKNVKKGQLINILPELKKKRNTGPNLLLLNLEHSSLQNHSPIIDPILFALKSCLYGGPESSVGGTFDKVQCVKKKKKSLSRIVIMLVFWTARFKMTYFPTLHHFSFPRWFHT